MQYMFIIDTLKVSYRLDIGSKVTGKHVLLLTGLHWYGTEEPPFLMRKREEKISTYLENVML